MTSLASLGTDPAASVSIGTPAERSHQMVLALVALGQLERDLQRLSRGLAPSAVPAKLSRRVRWSRVRRTAGGYPAL